MRWPWSRTETRQSADFTDALVALIEQQAQGQAVAEIGASAALETASGAFSRALSAARVSGPAWVRRAVTAAILGDLGRDLVRRGEYLAVVEVDAAGVRLQRSSDYDFHGDDDPRSWQVRVTTSGPSLTRTRTIPYTDLVHVQWSRNAPTPWAGVGASSSASATSRLLAEVERNLGDQAAGPTGTIMSTPSGSGTTLASLKAAIPKLRGRVVANEIAGQRAAGPGNSGVSPELRKLGLDPSQTLYLIMQEAYSQTLSACGLPPALGIASADGTSQRESLRRWHQGSVLPVARLIEQELSRKFEVRVSLGFDGYPLDLQGRASAFQRLVAGGVDVNEALVTSGLLADPDE